MQPLIPVFRRRPSWWNLDLVRRAGPRRIECAYLDAFACDFVVDARAGAPTDEPRFGHITFDQLRRDTGDHGIEGGLPATAVYRQLWTEEYRWQARRRPDVVIPFSEDPTLHLFVAACFGCFAQDGDLATFEDYYRAAFEAERVSITLQTFLDGLPTVARRPYLTPLAVASHGLRIGRRWPVSSATVLVVDASEPSDLVDLWNLRASGNTVLPLPTCWVEVLLDDLAKRLAARSVRRDRWDSRVAVVGAHRVDEETLRCVAARLGELGVAGDAVADRPDPPRPGSLASR